MDIFCEYMVERRRGAREMGIIAATVLGAILLSFLLTISLGAFSFIFVCGTWFGAWWLITRTNVEFEYIVTSTILDIDKITARRTRKRILSIDLKEITAWYPIDDINKPENVKIIDATPNGAEDGVYCIEFDKNGARSCLLFKPNKKMLDEIKKANPRLVKLSDEGFEG